MPKIATDFPVTEVSDRQSYGVFGVDGGWLASHAIFDSGTAQCHAYHNNSLLDLTGRFFVSTPNGAGPEPHANVEYRFQRRLMESPT